MRVEKQKMKQPSFLVKSVTKEELEEESRTSGAPSPVTAEKQIKKQASCDPFQCEICVYELLLFRFDVNSCFRESNGEF
ncbi:hypothetical protein L1887_24915 [Cichorium endivia]|nr:hypothetical protein L1887_24915 [Cichorium endivia]